MAGSTAVPVGASKLYSQRASTPCLGLAPSALAVCLGGVSALPSSTAVPRFGRSGAAFLGLPICLLSPLPSPCALVARVVGDVLSPPCPRLSSLGALAPSLVTLGIHSSPGNSVNPGLLLPCGNLTPPLTPWHDPHGFSATPEALRPPPPRPPLWGTCVPLQRPCGPRRRPAFPRCPQPDFPACLLVSPFVPDLPHGGPAFPPHRWPQMGLS